MASTNARETAYRILRNRIINLDLKPGEALNVSELAEEMGMSRTPVREAIIMLDIAKLVVVRPQSGTFVAPIVLEIAEMEQFARFTLEKEMIHLVCQTMTAVNESRYAENLRLYEFYLNSQAPDREEKLMDVDNDFHRIAFLINGKENHFTRMQSSLQHIERLRVLSLLAIKDDQVYGDHQQIAGALLKRDAAMAEYWLEKHMNRYQEHLPQNKKKFPQYFTVE